MGHNVLSGADMRYRLGCKHEWGRGRPRFYIAPFVGLWLVSTLSGCSGCQSTPEATAPTVAETSTEADASTASAQIEAEAAAPEERVPEGTETEIAEKGETAAAEAESPETDAGASDDESTPGGKESARSASQQPGKNSDGGDSDGVQSRSKPSVSAKDASDAFQQAQGLHEKALELANSGKFGRAFQEGLRGWELLNAFPQDSACSAMAKTLSKELESWARRANASQSAGGSSSDDKTLIEK